MGKKINNIDIVYPNLERGGAYCLAPLIFYNMAKNMQWKCNLVYLDRGRISSELVGFTLQYELDCLNIVEMLAKSNIPLDRRNRAKNRIVFAGGPVINNNPRLMERYFDFMVLGEGEEQFKEILDEYKSAETKEEFLKKLSQKKGFYVPGFNQPSYRYSDDLDSLPYPIEQPMPMNSAHSKEYVFGEVFILEIERGCPFMCKFCPMPSFYQKVKHRSMNKIKQIIDEGIKVNKRSRVVIYSASFVHPRRKEILRYMISKGLKFSVPSLKAEVVDEELLSLIRKGGQKTITLAPECNERLRKKIAKMTDDKVFFKAINYANRQGIESVKLYFMIGIPGQTMDDLEETVKLIRNVKTRFNGRIYVSINPFVPKPFTYFAECSFNKAEVKEQARFFRKKLSKLGVRYKISSISTAEKVWKIAKSHSFELSCSSESTLTSNT